MLVFGTSLGVTSLDVQVLFSARIEEMLGVATEFYKFFWEGGNKSFGGLFCFLVFFSHCE